MSDYKAFEAVSEFLTLNGHHVGNVRQPCRLPVSTMLLRQRLMLEELGELSIACHDRDLEKIADGMCDLLYVVIGTCVSYGIPVTVDLASKPLESTFCPPTVVSAQYLALIATGVSRCVRMVATVSVIEEAMGAVERCEVRDIFEAAINKVNDFAITCFINLEACFDEVHRSNMSKKLGGAIDGKKYGNGAAKGEGYQPPNLRSILGLA